MIIYKYSLGFGTCVIHMPTGAQVLTVQVQNDEPFIWALVDLNAPVEARSFRIIGTGHETKMSAAETYVGTFQQPPFVWHVFEVK